MLLVYSHLSLPCVSLEEQHETGTELSQSKLQWLQHWYGIHDYFGGLQCGYSANSYLHGRITNRYHSDVWHSSLWAWRCGFSKTKCFQPIDFSIFCCFGSCSADQHDSHNNPMLDRTFGPHFGKNSISHSTLLFYLLIGQHHGNYDLQESLPHRPKLHLKIGWLFLDSFSVSLEWDLCNLIK